MIKEIKIILIDNIEIMRRRNVGVAAIKKKREAAEKFETKGTELQESSLEAMSSQMETFRQNLEEFARNHKQDIKKDPAFRKHFQVGIPRFTEKIRYDRGGVLIFCINPGLSDSKSNIQKSILK